MVFFSAGKGGGELVDYGFKGKGMTTHLLVDGFGSPLAFKSTPANGDERQMVEPLIKQVEDRLDQARKLFDLRPIFEADKGYDAESLRDKLLKRKIYPWICRRKKPGKLAEKVFSMIKRSRWKVERAISWLQRKFRRLVARWERKIKYWKGFLNSVLILFWLGRLAG